MRILFSIFVFVFSVSLFAQDRVISTNQTSHFQVESMKVAQFNIDLEKDIVFKNDKVSFVYHKDIIQDIEFFMLANGDNQSWQEAKAKQQMYSDLGKLFLMRSASLIRELMTPMHVLEMKYSDLRMYMDVKESKQFWNQYMKYRKSLFAWYEYHRKENELAHLPHANSFKMIQISKVDADNIKANESIEFSFWSKIEIPGFRVPVFVLKVINGNTESYYKMVIE